MAVVFVVHTFGCSLCGAHFFLYSFFFLFSSKDCVLRANAICGKLAFVSASSLTSVWCVTALKEHSTECSVMFRRTLECQPKTLRNIWNRQASLLMWLRPDLTRADYTRHTKKKCWTKKKLCTDKWYRNLLDHCAGLIHNYKKCLVEVILPKEGQPVIKSKSTGTFFHQCCECLWMIFWLKLEKSSKRLPR